MMRWSVLLVALLAVSCANQIQTAPSQSTAPLTAAAVPFDPQGVFVTDGNSLTQSRNGAVPMPDNVRQLLGAPRLTFINAGESGHTTTEMLTTALTLVDPLYRPGALNILIAWEGGNDLFTVSPDVAIAHLREYSLARKRAGFSVFLLTLPPREAIGTPASFEHDRQTVNAALRAQWADFATGLIDIAADPIFASPSVVADGIYISPIDRVHLTDAGSMAVARIVVAAVRQILTQ